ncbi:winged helix-turn-helix domain-containing protein [Tahibacter soli]|uniref:Winged helix-turn-helix domain-containing protein n=1 Tax=Tahibacter soli TaxID=2983605 RepID=A0A9X4BK51_9GAMM|nr:winged helix-turn-helix domain-containing protein [Tahibacter soli]MDC8015776.1 winged helix-turn-helix domain-containing protein [Tahibacter soli]
MSVINAAAFRLGAWRIDPTSHELVASERRVRLQPKLMQLLLRLAREPGSVVRREQLLDDVWEGRDVNDEVLSRAIAELRQLLEDDPRTPRYIETLPKLGYRLVAAVEPADAAPVDAPRADTPRAETLRAGPVLDASGLPVADPGAKRRLGLAIAISIGVALALAVFLATMLPPAPGAFQDAGDLRLRVDRARPFATEPGYDQSARFSRDGRLVAWSASDEKLTRAGIWVGSRDGGTRRRLTDADAWDFSPAFVDGDTAVVFARYTAATCEVRKQSLLAQESVRLTDCAPPPATSRLDASADGRYVVFSQRVGDDGRSGLALLDLDGGKVSNLTDPGADAYVDFNPRFAGDGRQIAFFRGRQSEQRLWIMPTDTPARARNLVPTNGLLYGAAWLPGDTGLVLAGDLFGYRALYRVDAGTGALEFLGARGARYPDVAPDGTLVFEIADYQANLYRGDLADPLKPPEPVTTSRRYNNQPAHSPDGKRLAFVSNRDGLEAVYLADAAGGGAERLALDTAQRWVRPAWHADGGKLTVTAILNSSDGTTCLPYACSTEHSALYDYDLAAHAARRIDGLGDDARYALWSTDGTWLYYLRREGERNRLWRTAPARGTTPHLVIDANVEAYELDAGHLVASVQGEAGLRVCGLDAHECRRELTQTVAERPFLVDPGYWLLRDGKILFSGRRDDSSIVTFRLDLGNGKVSEAFPDGPTTLAPATSLSPDGKTFVYARTDRVSIDLYLGEPADETAPGKSRQ